MGVERVDYYSDDEYQQALQHEQRKQDNDEEQQPDQIDMMSESELRSELRNALSVIEAQAKQILPVQQELTTLKEQLADVVEWCKVKRDSNSLKNILEGK